MAETPDVAAVNQAAEEALAAAGDLTIDGATASRSIVDVMLDYLSFENIALQVAVVAVALGLGWLVSWRINAFVIAHYYGKESPQAADID